MVQPAPPPRPLPPRQGAAPERRTRTAAEIRRGVILLGWLCALLSVAAFVVAVVGFRQGWISYGVAKGGMVALAVPMLALLAVAFGLVGLVLAVTAKPRAGLAASLGAVALGALVFAVWSQADRVSASTPPVHDVATDWSDPPTFSPKVMMARGPRANPVELAPTVPEGPSRAVPGFLGRPVAEVNRDTCKAATPAILTTTPAEAYARAKEAVRASHMAVQTDDPAGGRLEASTARGLWGVTDDLVVRVRPEGAGARVDLRSIARAGLNDGGANCARIERLRRALEK